MKQTSFKQNQQPVLQNKQTPMQNQQSLCAPSSVYSVHDHIWQEIRTMF